MTTLNRPRVLVIDDEPALLRLLSHKLGDAGYEVFTAADGEAGWRAAISNQPDIIVADFNMPLLNGLDLCQKLLANNQTRQIPVIMATAYTTRVGPECALLANVKDTIGKPFSPRQLLARIKAILKSQAPHPHNSPA